MMFANIYLFVSLVLVYKTLETVVNNHFETQLGALHDENVHFLSVVEPWLGAVKVFVEFGSCHDPASNVIEIYVHDVASSSQHPNTLLSEWHQQFLRYQPPIEKCAHCINSVNFHKSELPHYGKRPLGCRHWSALAVVVDKDLDFITYGHIIGEISLRQQHFVAFTIGEVAGMSDAELNAWGMQAAEARLGEFGLSLSDLHEGMTEEEAMALAGKIMEAQYGGINMEELQKYMNSDMEGRENMTMEAVEEMNEKTIRTNSLRYIDMSIAQKRMEINAVIENKIMPKFREAEEKESIGLVSIRLYHDASVNAITVCKSELVPLYLDLAAFMDLGYAINQHTEYALREETPFAPLLYAFGIAQGLKSHPQPPLD